MPRVRPHDDHLIHCAIKHSAEVAVSSGFEAGVFVPDTAVTNLNLIVDKAENVPELFRVSGGDHRLLECGEVEVTDASITVGCGGHGG